MTIFFVALTLLTLMVFEKISFIKIEHLNVSDLSIILPIIFLVVFTIAGSLSFISEAIRKPEKIGPKFSKGGMFILCLVLIVLGMSFAVNLNRITVGWDAIALYDARAVFLRSGVTFSDMTNLSAFDPQNSYYYLLYPPFTSLVHYHWTYYLPNLPIGIFYSISLICLSIVIFYSSRKAVGNNLSLFLVFLVISSGTVFSSSILEYTNLPFSLFILLSIYLLNQYIVTKKKWYMFFGIAIAGSSQWIRFQEPIWLGVSFAVIVLGLLYKKYKHAVLPGLLLILYGVIERISWNTFVHSVSQTNEIISFNFVNLLEPVFGFFTGSFFTVLGFFVKSWMPMLIVYVISIFVVINKSKKDITSIFYMLFTISSILIYFIGLYYVSFQSTWWDKLGDSLVRSSTFLIPVGGTILLSYFKANKDINLKDE